MMASTPTFKYATSFHVQRNVFGMIFLRGVNVIRIVELGASFAQGPFSRKLDLAESHVREMNMKYKYAMKIPAQLIACGMNLDPGATALRNAMAELKPGLEQFNKKLLMEA